MSPARRRIRRAGALLGLVVALALAGPLLAPHDPVGPVAAPFSAAGLLGTDYLGADVLSRLLHGGRSVVLLSLLALAGGQLIGVTLGLAAGSSRGPGGAGVLRAVDALLALPALLLLAVLAAGFGTGGVVTFAASVLLLAPTTTRVVASATRELTGQPWLEAALLSGETRVGLLRRELLPNLVPVIAANAGIGLLGAVFLVSSASFLGFGPQPPAADWGLMVSENRDGIERQPLAVLAPAAAIALYAIAANLLADALARFYRHTGTATEVATP